MPFFIRDQKNALDRLHDGQPQHDDLLQFQQGPYERFLAERLAPFAAQQDDEEWFDEAGFRALGETGFMGLPYGEDVGGLEAPFSYMAAGLESLAKANAGFALGVAIHGTATDGINRYGNAELRARYVPDLAAGRRIACFALTEPDSGSDAKAMRTSFREDGDANLFLHIAWQRANESEIHESTVLQRWHDDRGTWQLAAEDRVGGDVGLFGEPMTQQAGADPVPAGRDVQFRTTVIRGE